MIIGVMGVGDVGGVGFGGVRVGVFTSQMVNADFPSCCFDVVRICTYMHTYNTVGSCYNVVQYDMISRKTLN